MCLSLNDQTSYVFFMPYQIDCSFLQTWCHLSRCKLLFVLIAFQISPFYAKRITPLGDTVMERKMFRTARNTYRPSIAPEDLV